ncbi:MAG: DUF1127 domain-containing protein [Kiloniellales bacterium]
MIQSQPSHGARVQGFSPRGLLHAAFDALLRWQDRASGRTQLAGLDERARKDMNLTDADIYKEYAKPVWRR